MSTATHRVEVQADYLFGVGTFTCEGGPDDECHQYPSCECEMWPCEHPIERQAVCWMTPWWNAGKYLVDSYLDDAGEFDRVEWHSGEVRGTWQGDGCTWQYA